MSWWSATGRAAMTARRTRGSARCSEYKDAIQHSRELVACWDGYRTMLYLSNSPLTRMRWIKRNRWTRYAEVWDGRNRHYVATG